MRPEEYIFLRGAEFYYNRDVKFIERVVQDTKTILHYEVKTHKVRLEIERLSWTEYAKKFTCDCTECSMPNIMVQNQQAWMLCSHIVSCILYHSLMLRHNKKG